MAGTKNFGDFKEIISPFLRNKINSLKSIYGESSKEYNSIASQYFKSDLEVLITKDQRLRHYQSEVNIYFENKPLIGVERLYKKTILIEPTTVCAAHCRWCLRAEYPIKTMKEEEIELATRYIGSDDINKDVDEVLITGGDPLMSLPLLRYTLDKISQNCKNIKIIRIGSRVPFQSPEKINDKMLEMFSNFKNFRFELGINVNHPLEFWDESVESLRKLKSINFKIYNQNPLLKSVNDDYQTLKNLYSLLREHDIESHYLFHAIPLRGSNHHRTSLKKGYDLVGKISSSGEFSGRSKPKYSVLSDIGKIVIYQDTIIDRNETNNTLLLRSGYKIEDRIKWNPSWKKPDSAEVDKNGYILTWYQDGRD
jgi:lysine 2,3-aminomutase